MAKPTPLLSGAGTQKSLGARPKAFVPSSGLYQAYATRHSSISTLNVSRAFTGRVRKNSARTSPNAIFADTPRYFLVSVPAKTPAAWVLTLFALRFCQN
jgi:hypothetical protein